MTPRKPHPPNPGSGRRLNRPAMMAYLRARGWGPWYHENYWTHPKTVADPKRQDSTNYGMPVEVAYRFESEGWPPFQPITGLPAINISMHPCAGPKRRRKR